MARALVPLAQGCEEIEAVTVIDLLRRAQIEVVSAGLNESPVICSRGTTLLADSTIAREQLQPFDIVILPGGQPGSDHLAADARIGEVLRRVFDSGGYIAAICAAPKVFAQLGLLKDVRATAYPGVLEGMPDACKRITHSPVEIDGRIITSRSPGTAMDFSLQLIEILCGSQRRHQVEQALQRG